MANIVANKLHTTCRSQQGLAKIFLPWTFIEKSLEVTPILLVKEE